MFDMFSFLYSAHIIHSDGGLFYNVELMTSLQQITVPGFFS